MGGHNSCDEEIVGDAKKEEEVESEMGFDAPDLEGLESIPESDVVLEDSCSADEIHSDVADSCTADEIDSDVADSSTADEMHFDVVDEEVEAETDILVSSDLKERVVGPEELEVGIYVSEWDHF